MGDAFTMADCAAAPALFYANLVAPSATVTRRTGGATSSRLMSRPSFARAVEEAKPYFDELPEVGPRFYEQPLVAPQFRHL